jgi:hypothetical protein
MKRTALLALGVMFMFSLGNLGGKNFNVILPSRTQLLDDMNQAMVHATELKQLREDNRRERLQIIVADPMHRYGGQLPSSVK